jgi:hypothetical protein
VSYPVDTVSSFFCIKADEAWIWILSSIYYFRG